MKRNSRNTVKCHVRIFSPDASEKKRGQIAGDPDGIVIFKIAERRADGAFVAHGRTGRIEGRHFAGAGEAGVVVLYIAGNRIAAADTKRGFDLWGIRKAIPAEMRERFRRRRPAVQTIARVKPIKHGKNMGRR